MQTIVWYFSYLYGYAMKILALAVKNIQASLIFLARLFVSLPPELYKSVIMALHIIDHPLVLHKLSIMRDKNTSTMKFRGLLEEIAMLMGYEITRDLPLTYEDIETPLMPMKAPKIAGKKVVIVPHVRPLSDAGLREQPLPRMARR